MLVRGGSMNREVLAMMRQNVRRPDMLWGDLQAQLASLAVGVANVGSFVSAMAGRPWSPPARAYSTRPRPPCAA